MLIGSETRSTFKSFVVCIHPQEGVVMGPQCAVPLVLRRRRQQRCSAELSEMRGLWADCISRGFLAVVTGINDWHSAFPIGRHVLGKVVAVDIIEGSWGEDRQIFFPKYEYVEPHTSKLEPYGACRPVAFYLLCAWLRNLAKPLYKALELWRPSFGC